MHILPEAPGSAQAALSSFGPGNRVNRVNTLPLQGTYLIMIRFENSYLRQACVQGCAGREKTQMAKAGAPALREQRAPSKTNN